MMNILFYIPDMVKLEELITKAADLPVLDGEKEICLTIDELSSKLLQVWNKPSLAVLFAPTRKELADLSSVRHLLSDIRIILILPDRDEETVSEGHTFYPRFISYSDSDLKDVFMVLEKMMKVLAFKGKEKGGDKRMREFAEKKGLKFFLTSAA